MLRISVYAEKWTGQYAPFCRVIVVLTIIPTVVYPTFYLRLVGKKVLWLYICKQSFCKSKLISET